jgi:hypothetical protein
MKKFSPHGSSVRKYIMKNVIFRYLCSFILLAFCVIGLPAQTVVEDFEFADTDGNAQAGTTASGTPTPSIFSATGADASEGTFALRADYVFSGAAFEAAFVERFLSSPYILSTPTAEANISNFAVRLDVKGDPAFAGSSGTNIFMILFDADGEQWRFINFTEPALNSATYTNGLQLTFFDVQAAADSVLSQVNAVQIIIENPEAVAKSGSLFFDRLEFEELVAPVGNQIDDMEFATDDTAAAAGTTVFNDVSVILTPRSGSGADANEGSNSLGFDLNMGGVAFEFGSLARTLPAPLALGDSYSESNPAGTQIADLRLRLDVKGDPAFAGTAGTNLWVRLFEADGDTWRFINFTDAALNSASFTDDHIVGFFDREATAGDGNLTEITGYEILFQNPEAIAKVGTIFVDDLQLQEPGGSGGLPTGLTYTISLIDPMDAPNVSDTTFDAIYSNGSTHQAITGDDWKDWESRLSDPGTVISNNPTDPVTGAAIASTSEAYFISDGENLYFGMIVYDSDTSLMTADTGDDTFTKFNVEDIEVAISPRSGTDGPGQEIKIVMDAFGNIDDMVPDGTIAIDTSAKTNSNSYIIDTNRWALEWQIGIEELLNLSFEELSTPLNFPPSGTWYGHIGYQSPFSGGNGRVPLYAAGHANGFGNYTIEFDLSNLPSLVTPTENWTHFE